MQVRAPLVVLLVLLLSASTTSQTRSGENRQPRRSASIAGRILHPDGAAAEHARVAIYAVREGAAAAIIGMGTTAHDGRYEVNGLLPGPVIVGATPQRGGGFGGDTGRPPALQAESLYPGVVDRDRAQPVMLFDGIQTEGIDVWLAPGPQRFSISGSIFGPPDVALDDLVIEYGGPGAIRRGLWHVDDPRGVFTIEGVAQGTYVLLARAETASGPLLAIAATDVALGPVEDVRLVLRRPGSIAGVLRIEGTAAIAPDGIRIAPVQTLLTLSPFYPVDEVAPGADGRFEIPHLAGEYTLNVEGLPAGWRVRRVLRDGVALPGERIAVGAAERVTGIEVVVGPAPR